MGDAGNPNDPTTGFGQVNYNYHIGTYEVTNAQYTSFLNSVAARDKYNLYSTHMEGITRSGSDGSYSYSTIVGHENKPVYYISFWDAARFTNWLTTGNTETGVYNLGGVRSPFNQTITRDALAWANGGVAIASEDEWYKAAYYSGSPTGADGDGYWLYPTQSNSITTDDANYTGSNMTAVGTYADDASYYGTFDQGGNVWEWSDEFVSNNSSKRVVRGGSILNNFAGKFLKSSHFASSPPGGELLVGFRVSSLEPITETSEVVPVFGLPWLVLLIGSLLGFGYRKLNNHRGSKYL